MVDSSKLWLIPLNLEESAIRIGDFKISTFGHISGINATRSGDTFSIPVKKTPLILRRKLTYYQKNKRLFIYHAWLARAIGTCYLAWALGQHWQNLPCLTASAIGTCYEAMKGGHFYPKPEEEHLRLMVNTFQTH